MNHRISLGQIMHGLAHSGQSALGQALGTGHLLAELEPSPAT